MVFVGCANVWDRGVGVGVGVIKSIRTPCHNEGLCLAGVGVIKSIRTPCHNEGLCVHRLYFASYYDFYKFAFWLGGSLSTQHGPIPKGHSEPED